LIGSEDSVAGFITGGFWSRDYDTGEFGTEDEWEGRLVLVFSCHLEEVKEVCCCGVDFDEDFH
jgi:hypothetical protein